MIPGYLATPSREAQIRNLLAWIADLNRNAMPWAEPPEPPSQFDRRDAEEAEDFARRYAQRLTPVTENPHLFPLRRCDSCGYRVNAPGHKLVCGAGA